MVYVSIIILCGVLMGWLWALSAVHVEYRKSGRIPLLMTLTFCTLGLAGVLLIVARKTNLGRLSKWLEQTTKTVKKPAASPKAPKAKAKAEEKDEEILEAVAPKGMLQLINNHGVAISPEIVESSPDGGLAAACKIIQEAVNLEATDIHLQPEPGQLLVRYRLDGVLQNGQTYPAEAGAHIVSAVKVLADMDVAEKRRAQDGAFSALASHGKINFRVSSVGIADGEKMALRLLDKSKGLRTIKDLGFSKAMHARVEALLQSSHGVFVVCGPTGCGKTTTLYAALQELDRHALNIITIENPIEYRLDGINQQSINEKAGITFAGLLRTSLRQDPDILMVGEVRDKETAEIAMQAAMTGHLVFTTVHANDTVSAMFRLMNLGVEPFLISSSLAGVLAQRLVRRVCMQCRGARKPTEEEMNLFAKVGFKPEQVRAIPVVKGCKACRNTGYKGRVGIFELLTINDDIRSLIQHNPSVTDMKKAALKAGLVRLGQDAMQKAACGITSLEDAQRACR